MRPITAIWTKSVHFLFPDNSESGADNCPVSRQIFSQPDNAARNPASHEAQSLAHQGVEVVQGDLEDPASIACAATGVYGIYSVQDFWAVGAKREVQQGKNVADGAKKANVKHFVYSSVGSAERNTEVSPR